jgi:thioredoxin 1
MIHVTDDNFQDVISSNELVLVDFWADWCGPCKKMLPILEEINDEGILPVGKINADENPVKTQEYSVHSIPTMVLFINGEPMHTIIGAKPKHLLLKEIDPWI